MRRPRGPGGRFLTAAEIAAGMTGTPSSLPTQARSDTTPSPPATSPDELKPPRILTNNLGHGHTNGHRQAMSEDSADGSSGSAYPPMTGTSTSASVSAGAIGDLDLDGAMYIEEATTIAPAA